MQSVMASPLSEQALRLIKTGNEIASKSVVLSGQQLLLKGMFKFNDLDAAYESSRQTRMGNPLMGYSPQPVMANKILEKLLKKGYDPAIYDVALYLLDGESGFIKDELMALNLLEQSVKAHANPQSAFVAAVIRNEALVSVLKDNRQIDELITFAILNQVPGAKRYQAQYINNRKGSLRVENWRQWFANQ
ncbi:conserved hypothetical protein [endosymbiont of Bathymodiolus septemdierum str. Myojin knoll]|uniref:Uncharacterized protein n=2 Tax=sulfur-oxidizing symbionts TaxID=32036 RepID=A0A0P0UPT0_9GAMM|nr:conserved hypothetical protein [endosymbiont of Bathymodiolus septemdierum str. Myojin knoll]